MFISAPLATRRVTGRTSQNHRDQRPAEGCAVRPGHFIVETVGVGQSEVEIAGLAESYRCGGCSRSGRRSADDESRFDGDRRCICGE